MLLKSTDIYVYPSTNTLSNLKQIHFIQFEAIFIMWPPEAVWMADGVMHKMRIISKLTSSAMIMMMMVFMTMIVLMMTMTMVMAMMIIHGKSVMHKMRISSKLTSSAMMMVVVFMMMMMNWEI